MCSVTQLCVAVYDPRDCSTPDSCPWNFSGKNTRVGRHFLLQGIFLIWVSNPGLLHCNRILLSRAPPGKDPILLSKKLLSDISKINL